MRSPGGPAPYLRPAHSVIEPAPTFHGLADTAQYYGASYRSALCPSLARINAYLVRWLRKKYKRLRSYTCASCRSKALLGTRHLR